MWRDVEVDKRTCPSPKRLDWGVMWLTTFTYTTSVVSKSATYTGWLGDVLARTSRGYPSKMSSGHIWHDGCVCASWDNGCVHWQYDILNANFCFSWIIVMECNIQMSQTYVFVQLYLGRILKNARMPLKGVPASLPPCAQIRREGAWTALISWYIKSTHC